ncbi:MAG: BolA/IbaG family iron-sulfur metabolism protein [Bdellovibrionales bacterium]|nr:BolA/IbaG family iron-sulfur metabolism protein [Bdellovibrionales bacterium]
MTPEEMENRIKAAYPDCDVAVIDSTGTQDHFDVRVASGLFKDLTRIKQHQAIMALFQDELKTGEVHALAIKTIVK